jgi:hypothetical protein
MIWVQILKRARQQTLALTVLCGFCATFCFVPVLSSHAAGFNESVMIDLSSYQGRWEKIEDDEFDAARLSAIDSAINGLSWIVRRMAAGVLRKTTAPPPEMEFFWDGKRLHQALQGKDRAKSRPVLLDGRLRSGKDPRGVPFSWAWAWTDGGLRVNWEQHQAIGNNVYRIDERDDHTLVVQHTIQVTAISNIEPIVYLSRFSRTDPPARAAGELDKPEHAAAD